MKKILFLFLLCLVLAGCDEKNTVNEIKQENESNMIVGEDVSSNIIDGFKKAEHKEYNSYASENGLGGELIYAEGTILTCYSMEDGLYAFNLQEDDGDRWCCVFPPSIGEENEKILECLVEQKCVVYGEYIGFSDIVNLPSIKLFTQDISSKVRVDVLKDGKYVSVWSMEDYINEYIQNQNEKKESVKENQSKETISVEQMNAIKKAESYLEFMAFSYIGLVEQLEYEGFPKDVAEYAVENCGADWNEQAVKKAESYLEFMAFSRESLIEQLEYEGFTHEEAVYGAEQNGF